ncbi:MAG TPA: hypothetical protein VGN00_23485 [Puia sp.]|jgi:hypothetical protein
MDVLGKILFRLRKFRKEPIIPPYEEKRAILLSYKNKYALNIFIETGTFLGDTVDFFKNTFDKLYSIELSKELADKAARRFEGQPKIKIIQGDSGKVLTDLVKGLGQPALFWLDGHYSSEFFLGDEYIKTARADKDTPIEQELNIVLNTPEQHIILIDDARLFDGHGDYPSLRTIRKKVAASPHKFQVFVEKDIINIIPQ